MSPSVISSRVHVLFLLLKRSMSACLFASEMRGFRLSLNLYSSSASAFSSSAAAFRKPATMSRVLLYSSMKHALAVTLMREAPSLPLSRARYASSEASSLMPNMVLRTFMVCSP